MNQFPGILAKVDGGIIEVGNTTSVDILQEAAANSANAGVISEIRQRLDYLQFHARIRGTHTGRRDHGNEEPLHLAGQSDGDTKIEGDGSQKQEAVPVASDDGGQEPEYDRFISDRPRQTRENKTHVVPGKTANNLFKNS